MFHPVKKAVSEDFKTSLKKNFSFGEVLIVITTLFFLRFFDHPMTSW
jgi:hypothetical protein